MRAKAEEQAAKEFQNRPPTPQNLAKREAYKQDLIRQWLKEGAISGGATPPHLQRPLEEP